MTQETTSDDFLGGAIRVLQPKQGYRAATDPVFLAASVPAKKGDTILDVGCGVGVAALCLAHRVPECTVTGIELQQYYAALALENQRCNNLALDFVTGDIANPPPALKAQVFDHVMTNPPFFDGGAHSAPIDGGKTVANVEGMSLTEWIEHALRRLTSRGTFTIIHRAERLPEITAALFPKCGDIIVQPLAARQGNDAGRVIVQARKAAAGPARLRAPLVIHVGTEHTADQSSFTPDADAILRHGAKLPL